MTIVALWLVSAIFVFVVSAIIWMAMPWHKSDFSKTSDEEGVRSAHGRRIRLAGDLGLL